MGRIADSTIKGFMYQFNLSLNEILKSADEVIKDIEKIGKGIITAIQCKYHEESKKFQWSMVYKPILLMIKTFSGLETDNRNISFVLYAFFPSEQIGEKRYQKRYNN